MALPQTAFFCACGMVVFWMAVGLPFAARLAAHPLRWFLAPMLGWAISSVITFLLFSAVGMSRPVVIATELLVLSASVLGTLFVWRSGEFPAVSRPPNVLIIALIGAALLAAAVMLGVLPKTSSAGVELAAPIFDHSKIALVDEIIRSGVPAINPFFNEVGAPDYVSYYYLWHFSAAAMAVAVGISGWEADAALTGFTAFASLSMMIGFAVWFSGRSSAALLTVAIGATASLRMIAAWLLGNDTSHAIFGTATGFGGWLFQVCWAPQHVASATLAIIAVYLITRLANGRDLLTVGVLAVVFAASFESSAWVGGITFAMAAVAVGIQCLAQMAPRHRASFLIDGAVAGAIGAVLVLPFLRRVGATALRDNGFPVEIAPLHVLGDGIPDGIARFLDLPAYWLIYLPLEFPAFYPLGAVALILFSAFGTFDTQRKRLTRAFLVTTAVSLIAAWLLVSTLGVNNNDLSWRSVLPGVMLLMIFAAAAIARLLSTGARMGAFVAIGVIALGMVDGGRILWNNMIVPTDGTARIFQDSQQMWQAVRRHSNAAERVANNPKLLTYMTPWPINISWALLADRRSCFASNELAIAFAPISAARRAEVEGRFFRVFDGKPEADDLQQLAERHRCDVVVVMPLDGAWTNDPFASSNLYRMVESRPDQWRIYRSVSAQK